MRHQIRAGESGQALILVVVAAAVLIVMAALAIDIAQWYQKHHTAQVAADAAALAAATCMANAKVGATCTDNSDTTHASSVATAYAGTNGIVTPTTQVSVDTTNDLVTVTTTTPAPLSFAGVSFAHTLTAVAVSSWNKEGVPLSLITGNQSCAAGTGLVIQSNGGGHATVNGLYSDGLITNNDNSGSAHFGGTQYNGTGNCTAASSYNPKNTNVSGGPYIAYPDQFTEPTVSSTACASPAPLTGCTWRTQPPAGVTATITPGTCTFAATFFSTDATGANQINQPGIYCVVTSAANSTTIPNAYPTGSGNTDCADGVNRGGTAGGKTTNSDDQPGSIYVGSVVSGQYEFVGPCVVANGGLSPAVTQITGSACSSQPPNLNTCPIVYSTNQVDTGACLNPSSTPPNMVNDSEIVGAPQGVFLDGNNLVLSAPIYDPCGTAELYGNTQFGTLIEAANIVLDKNNFTTFTGKGPPDGGGLIVLIQ
jgi:Flp pilus assembly protein TadG